MVCTVTILAASQYPSVHDAAEGKRFTSIGGFASGNGPGNALDGSDTTVWEPSAVLSESGISVDLDGQYEVYQISASFVSNRPLTAVIERSSNHGDTWSVYQYFSDNCSHDFNMTQDGRPDSFTDVVCIGRDSGVSHLCFTFWFDKYYMLAVLDMITSCP